MRRCRSCRIASFTTPRCFPQLLNFLTVPVSEMFRDPSYFRALREIAVPFLRTYPVAQGLGRRLQHRRGGLLARDPAARGRPARAHADLRDRHQPADACSRRKPASSRPAAWPALPRATGSRAAAARSRTTTPRRTAARSSTRRCKKHMVFSDHSLATDSVFAEMQLVSCRNVLIYFNRELQDRAVGLFRESLCRGGYLGHRLARDRCASRRTPRRSSKSRRPIASTRNGTRRDGGQLCVDASTRS